MHQLRERCRAAAPARGLLALALVVISVVAAALSAGPAGAIGSPPVAAGRPAMYAERLARLQATTMSARAASVTFDPDIVISDANFRAAGSMTLAQVQSFLAAQSGVLGSYSTPNADGVVEPASQIIWEAAQAWKVSPKVILATLQKEQGLLTATAPTSYALDWAMGCGVPDSGSLQTKYQGFGKQVWYGADSLAVDGAGWHAGITKKCGDGSVSPANVSTYSLYTYTPWIAGNQLFWTVYWRYFGDPVGDVTPPATPAPWTVTLALSASQVDAGATVTYSGSVNTMTGLPGTGQVTVQRRPAAGGSWRAWRKVTLTGAGSFAVAVKMTSAPRDWQVRARMPADGTNLAGYSAPLSLSVDPAPPPKWRVSLSLSRSSAPKGGRVRYSGRVRSATGAAAHGRVAIQRRLASGGPWRTWRTAALRSGGSYRVTVKMTHRNSWRCRARMPGTAGDRVGFSPARRLMVL